MKRLKLIFVGTIFFLTACGNNLEMDSLRSIDQGELIGLNGENNTYTWKGIPFAKPPVNNLRWKATQEANSWNGRLEATDFKQACFQRGSVFENNDSEWSGNEDCLYLNIWTPELSKEQIEQSQDKLPVMMWIHGGANVVGSAHTYDPSSLVSNHNVIVVTIQYRMGPLGWFRHPALHNDDSTLEDRSGNYGTLDTIMALRWINENIHHFGGDADNVTVFGESAGGHNSAAIFASPLAQGLFHKVIVESGIMSVSSIKAAESYLPEDGIAPTVSGLEIFNHLLIQDGKANSIKDAKETQLSMTREEIRDFFYAQPPEALMKAMNDAGPKRDGMTRVFPDGLVILSGGIKEAFNNSKFNRVPIITGTNKDENKFFNSMNRNFVEWGPATGLYKTAGIEEMPLKIIDLDYYEAINFYGSSFWKQRAVDTPSRLLTESGHGNTYAYRFDWDELSTINDMDLSKLIGAAHAMEILFVFGSFDSYLVRNFLFGEGAYPAAKKLSEQMQSYWAEFAYTGSPGKGRNNDLPEWRKWSLTSSGKYIVLDSENDQGIFMEDTEYSVEYLLNKLEFDPRLDDQQKCETLFGLSYGDGNGVSNEEFNSFMNGSCAVRDYSSILDMIESVEEELINNQD